MTIHPSPDSYRELIQVLPPRGWKHLEHLMACSRCRSRFLDWSREELEHEAGKVLPWPGASSGEEQAGAAFWPGVAHGDERFLEELPAEVWLPEEGGGPLEGWTLVERLLDASRQERQRDPGKAESLALAAGRVLEQLPQETGGVLLAMDLRGLAWTYVAVARQMTGDLRGADGALLCAEAALRQGSGDPLERATFLEVRGLLRRDQRRFDESERLFTKAVSLFRSVGDAEAETRALVNLANVLDDMGQVERALEILGAAAVRPDLCGDSFQSLVLRHNLATTLVDAGRYEEAEALLLESRGLYEEFGDTYVRIRRRWLEAKITRARGQSAAAEDMFLEVREEFIQQGAGYDAALVSLELATLYAEQSRFSEMRSLADEMLPIFRSQDIHREALAALAIFQQAVRMEKITLKLAREIADYLGRARSHPDLRFELE